MEPIFMFFDKVSFDKSDAISSSFTLKFSDGDALEGVLFKKTSDYYVTSLSCSVTIEKDLKELKEYEDIKEISDIANGYLTNGVDHFKKTITLSTSIFYKGITEALVEDQTKQLLSLVTVPFIDLNTEDKNTVKVYSPYQKLKIHGLKFSNRYVNYNLNLITENNELVIEKKADLRSGKTLLINQAIFKTYSDNLVMIKYLNTYRAHYFRIAKYHNSKRNELAAQALEQQEKTHRFVYDSLFIDLTSFLQYVISLVGTSKRYPIYMTRTFMKIHPNTEVYFTPSLYEKLKTKMTFEASITLNQRETSELRGRYSWFGSNATFYRFVNKNSNAQWTLSALDFNLLDDDIKITPNLSDAETIFNFSSNFNNSSSVTVKTKSPNDIEKTLQSNQLNVLQSNEINPNSLTYAHENFFLYDLENMILPTFTTELQQQFNIYGLIYFSGEQKDKLDLVKPTTKLKFRVSEDIYKKQIKFEIAKVHAKKTFNIGGSYISNFSILRTEKGGIGNKRKMKNEIINEIPILGIQNSEFNVLNPIYISINSNEIIDKLQLYRGNRFKFTLTSLLFSSNIQNNTDVILVTSNGLSDTKQALITKDNKPILENTLGICFLNEIAEWKIVKGASKRVQVVFSDSEDVTRNNNQLAFSFITKNITDLLQFSVTLLDGTGQKITFPDNETKLPIINCSIQILK